MPRSSAPMKVSRRLRNSSRSCAFRVEFNHRAASVPYFTGAGGVTPDGGNNGSPGAAIPGWKPDLINTEDRLSIAMMLKY